MNVKTTFLHRDLHEQIYMVQPEGFEDLRKGKIICKLKTSLYYLKQAPKQWCNRFYTFILSQRYKRTVADQCIYIQRLPNGNFIALLLYAMLILG